MYARVTPFELDTLRMPLRDAVTRFEQLVLPEIQRQPGYAGMQVMSTSEGRGMLITLWETEAAAAAGIASGFYDEQVAKFLMLLREPPGRDHYAVLLTDTPAMTSA